MKRIWTGSVVLILAAMLLLDGGCANRKASMESSGKKGSELVLIPGGEFLMGSPDGEGEENEHPQHRVHVDSFYLSRYEVTNAQWQQFVEANPEWRKGGMRAEELTSRPFTSSNKYLAHWEGNDPPEGQENHPVICVSWHAAQAYCAWAGVRLPTEAEWEYAAQGGKGYEYGTSTGNLSPKLANYKKSLGRPVPATVGRYLKPVGSYPANPFGIYDLSGNVWEFCSSGYQAYPYHADDGREDLSQTNVNRVLRGGSWDYFGIFARSRFRNSLAPGDCHIDVGFRVAADARRSRNQAEEEGPIHSH